MIREVAYFLRHGPSLSRRQSAMERVEFQQWFAAQVDAVVVSTVLCSVQSVEQALTEFKRVLKPGGKLRLLEHVRSEHWPAGVLMDLFNPLWLRLNMVGCNMNRQSLEAVRDAGFRIVSVKNYKPFFPSAPTPFPSCLIRAEK